MLNKIKNIFGMKGIDKVSGKEKYVRMFDEMYKQLKENESK